MPVNQPTILQPLTVTSENKQLITISDSTEAAEITLLKQLIQTAEQLNSQTTNDAPNVKWSKLIDLATKPSELIGARYDDVSLKLQQLMRDCSVNPHVQRPVEPLHLIKVGVCTSCLTLVVLSCCLTLV